MYKDLNCPLKCTPSGKIDNQEHILTCVKLNDQIPNVVLASIYGDLEEQETVASVLTQLMMKRNSLLEMETASPTRGNPGPELSLGVPTMH